MKKKVTGSLSVMSSLQLTELTRGLDEACKSILRHREILAFILKHMVKEYENCSYEEIISCMDPYSFGERDVSPGRTSAALPGNDKEFIVLNEKTSNFDLFFRARNPLLSTEEITVELYVDIEPQKDYRPGYPIEKRGIYYGARMISSQLSMITKDTDYSSLSKVYTIWICRDRIPRREIHTISRYEIVNTENVGEAAPAKDNYDLFAMIIVRLGKEDYNGSVEIMDFLNSLFYPGKGNILKKLERYIDFTANPQLKKEVTDMSGLGQSVLEQGLEQGLEEGLEQGIALVITNMIRKGNTCEEIAGLTDIPLNQVLAIERKLRGGGDGA